MHNLFFLLILLASTTTTTNSLEVVFHNVQKAKGTLQIAVFDDAEKFDARSPAVFQTAIAIDSKDDIKVQIPTLKVGGTYCIAAFQDLNDNGELDTNMLGIPTEPYAFSNNPKVKWQAPTFAETSFKAEEESSMRLRLATWSQQ